MTNDLDTSVDLYVKAALGRKALGLVVLDVRHLQVQFLSENKPVVAVDNLSFQLGKGEKLGIVGESGSGKSVTSLAIMGLIPTPGKVTQGEIWFYPEGKDKINLLQVSEAQRRSYRGGEIAMIFQEPMSALNPVYNIVPESIQVQRAWKEAGHADHSDCPWFIHSEIRPLSFRIFSKLFFLPPFRNPAEAKRCGWAVKAKPWALNLKLKSTTRKIFYKIILYPHRQYSNRFRPRR